MTAAALGGTVSVIGGGKFANGAVSGAMVNLFNHQAHHNPARDVATRVLQDGHLTLSEANEIWRANIDPNFEVTVDATRLSVRQLDDFAGPNNTAPGRIQGVNDYLVHGQVRLQQMPDGSVRILSGTYDFQPHDVSRYSSTAMGYTRNTATYGGFWLGSRVGTSVGTDYLIQYQGQPRVVR